MRSLPDPPSGQDQRHAYGGRGWNPAEPLTNNDLDRFDSEYDLRGDVLQTPGFALNRPGPRRFEEQKLGPDSPAPGGQRRDANRRISLMERELMFEQQCAQINYYQPQPSYDDIYLSYLTPKAVMRFINQVLDYFKSFRIRLPVPALIDRDVRARILARNSHMTEDEFLQMNLPAITALLRNEVAPRDPIQFVTVLKAAVKFPSLDGAELSIKDFRSFYDALLMYKREFLLYYDFMALPDLSNVPGTDDKELGIISLFTDPIPNDYGHKIAAVIRRERESLPRDDRKFRDLHQFVASFMKKAAEDFQTWDQHRIMQYHFSSTSKKSIPKQRQRLTHIAEAPESPPDDSDLPDPYRSYFPEDEASDRSDQQGGDPVEEGDDYQSDSGDQDDGPSIDDDPDDFYEQEVAAISGRRQGRPSFREKGGDSTKKPQSSWRDSIKKPQSSWRDAGKKPSALLNSTASPKPALDKPSKKHIACPILLLEDSCRFGDKCIYSHDPKVLAARRSELMAKKSWKP